MTRRARRAKPRRAKLRGLVLAALAIGLLFAQGNRVFHDLLVQHAICEHGALVHGEASHGALAGHNADRDHAGTEVVQDDAKGNRGADHDHCDVKSLVHRMAEVGPGVAPPSLLHIDPPLQQGNARAFAPIALLDLAPKSSPPRP